MKDYASVKRSDLIPQPAAETEVHAATQFLVETPGYGTTPSTVGSLAAGLGDLDLQAYDPALNFGLAQNWAQDYLYPVDPPSSAGTSTLLGGGTPAGTNEYSPKAEEALLDEASLAASEFNLPTAHDETTE